MLSIKPLFQTGTVNPSNNTTSNDRIIRILKGNPSYLHYSKEQPATINSWVYVPSSTEPHKGTFYAYTAPSISVAFINGLLPPPPGGIHTSPFARLGYWNLNSDTSTLHDTAKVIQKLENTVVSDPASDETAK